MYMFSSYFHDHIFLLNTSFKLLINKRNKCFHFNPTMYHVSIKFQYLETIRILHECQVWIDKSDKNDGFFFLLTLMQRRLIYTRSIYLEK